MSNVYAIQESKKIEHKKILSMQTDNKIRGKLYESQCIEYLKNIFHIDEIYEWSDVPVEILKKMNLVPEKINNNKKYIQKDIGCDIVMVIT